MHLLYYRNNKWTFTAVSYMNVSFNIIISNTKTCYKDSQKIKYKNFENIMTYYFQRLFVQLAEFKK